MIPRPNPPWTGPRAGKIVAVASALFHKRRIRHGAHPYFQFVAAGPFSSARGPERSRGGRKKGRFSTSRGERSQNATETLKVMCSGAGNGERGFCLGKAERLCKVAKPKQRAAPLACCLRPPPKNGGFVGSCRQQQKPRWSQSKPGWGCGPTKPGSGSCALCDITKGPTTPGGQADKHVKQLSRFNYP